MINMATLKDLGRGRLSPVVLIPAVILGLILGLFLDRGFTGTQTTSGPNASGTVLGIGQSPPASTAQDVEFRVFWDMWRTLKDKYYEQPLEDKQMLYGAMRGLADSAGDPYTAFFEPKEAELFQESLSGKFGGIGAEIGLRNDRITVIAPLPDTPAERAGLKAGDIILSVDETSLNGYRVDQAVGIIRGERGTTVTLRIVREVKGKPSESEIKIVRDEIVIKSVRLNNLKNGIAHIELLSFNADTPEAFDQVVDDVLRLDPKGIVLDMRNNPGGFLQVAQYVAGAWLGDLVVVKERRQGVVFESLRGTGRKRLEGIPTVVLINEGSASASEIVAGALQDYGLAKLVGKKTFGKGSVQDLIELRDGAAVKITIAEWLTPKERVINNAGLEPDVIIERTLEDYEAQKDPQLDRAVGILDGTAPAAGATSTR